ncbi:MFS transporter MCP family solute carrier family 16 member 10 [Penicillium malachiteum]|uniref:MFS transporter MCP family solute carrier family 16 member 10 n=1 Tax=Penicillium malachiteum TaxID=1324776 RepID=UPI00254847A8|nr:MFS transporter MCP family solute carrier family 16 member 10 [Penicillium malachiteum]KAJ5714838.1 MFS transporter MCP family solute carrier family 16 member 10 [Penicillium malachiteum]
MRSESKVKQVLEATGVPNNDSAESSGSATDKEERVGKLIEMAGEIQDKSEISKDIEKKVMEDNSDDESDAQDGGTRAWLQVLGSFLVFSNIWGPALAYGIYDFISFQGAFKSFYEITYLPNTSASALSWVGTTANFLLIFGGILTGPLFDMGFFRTMLLIGALIETLAVFLLSLCTKYWQVLLTQGIMLGIGCCFLYMPGLALVGRSFRKHRAAALACAISGAPIGAILFDAKAFLDLPFVVYTTSNFMVFFAYLVPFIYMSSFAQLSLGMSSSAANLGIIVTQTTSIVGHLMAGYIAGKIGNITQWIICALGSGVLCIGWIGVQQPWAYYFIFALFGIFSGPLLSLPPSAFPLVCPDPKVIGTRLGMASAIGACASLVGSPVEGALEGLGGHAFLGPQIFCGLCMMIGGCTLVILWGILGEEREASSYKRNKQLP